MTFNTQAPLEPVTPKTPSSSELSATAPPPGDPVPVKPCPTMDPPAAQVPIRTGPFALIYSTYTGRPLAIHRDLIGTVGDRGEDVVIIAPRGKGGKGWQARGTFGQVMSEVQRAFAFNDDRRTEQSMLHSEVPVPLAGGTVNEPTPPAAPTPARPRTAGRSTRQRLANVEADRAARELREVSELKHQLAEIPVGEHERLLRAACVAVYGNGEADREAIRTGWPGNTLARRMLAMWSEQRNPTSVECKNIFELSPPLTNVPTCTERTATLG